MSTPSPDTTDTSAGTRTPIYPFPGLRPFREDEEFLFFGRENQVDAMVDKLAATHFLAVIGGSGSGKSSLVNCGLRPALRAGLMASAGTTWRMAQFRPGSDPLAQMARALAKEGVLFSNYQATGLTLTEIVDTTLRMSKLGLIDIFEQAKLEEGINLLVVVDQFEELFRYRQLCAGQAGGVSEIAEQAAAFVNLLLEVKAQTKYPIHVVLTMRSDFLGDCAQFPGLAEAINAGQYLVPRMTRDERRVAITGPAGVGGAEISPVLLTRLINDVGDNPDQLSILQHALNRTWARWCHEGGAQGPLELAHYEAIGTMANALDQHAERAYAELDTRRKQQLCEKMFKALTDKATDPRGVRRPTTMGTLCTLAGATPAEITEVVEVFRKASRSFLMPPAGEPLENDTVIDISHESLMRVWQRLIKWTDDEARSARTYRRLAESASLHAAGKASLWREADLTYAQAWQEREAPNATWAARYAAGFEEAMAFLKASEAANAAELEQERQQAEAAQMAKERELEQRARADSERAKAVVQMKAAKRQRHFLYGLTVLLLGVFVVAVLALRARREALRQKENADKALRRANTETQRAMAIIRFLDTKVGETFGDKVPLQLRELVDTQIDTFYKEHDSLAKIEDHERMRFHIRKALVHFEVMKGYETSHFGAKAIYSAWQQASADSALKEALRIGQNLAAKSPDDRRITRDLIVTHYYLARFPMKSNDAKGAAAHLRSAQMLFDSLVAAGPFSRAHWVAWMNLPDPDLGANTGNATANLAAIVTSLVQMKEPPTDAPNGPAPGKGHANQLGMRFVQVDEAQVQFSVHQTRVKDFLHFVRETGFAHMRETADENSRMWSWDKDGLKQRGQSWEDPGFKQTENDPVVGVSWNDAMAFCEWLTLRERAAGRLPTGWEYRLPKDEEWSMAAGLHDETGSTPKERDQRNKSETRFPDVYPWGNQWPPPAGAGNFAGTEAADEHWPSNLKTIPDYRDAFAKTAPVGSFKPNKFGIYDLGSNVKEWCEDIYEPGDKYQNRVVRGASWIMSYKKPSQLLSSRRDLDIPTLRTADFGFRCVAAPISRQNPIAPGSK